MTPAPDTLRALLAEPGLITMPCCFDPLSAKLIEQAGFPLTFMSGFAAAAARLGMPDTGLMSYAEVADQGRNICNAVSIPVIGDGDTGYGNAVNVKRTVQGFAQAGFAAVMIEDQVSPKRCGHVAGKSVVDRDEAFARIRAAADARAEGADILILARTDARHEHGLDEAIARAARFAELGADILFVEAPRDEAEMARVPAELPRPCMANIVEGGMTPALPPAKLEAMGYRIAAYPLTLMAAAMQAMVEALDGFRAGTPDAARLMAFDELKRRIGFDAYFDEEKRYAPKD
ncbi:2-methylisocitrate lyase-like PEP mutase family enzyme [Rhodovulum iodosum]|uniref:2-methylisocitrate lyase-like PEP mutase family enzyme n=1 Tax=Rhodovulum iodosum TaxID=68291 RepID=A0ABV3XTU4_9RHOB|nr:isocitrate lyase/PEP mutase family protein [Rhodovulum robiginosum]RSK32192.1 isocitrate lyase/PEP mutase family protein [Rhodovulum robiginosum]